MSVIQRTGNPAFGEKIFAKQGFVAKDQAMTVQGTVNKTLMLFVLMIIPAYFVWNQTSPETQGISPLTWVGMAGGLISALVVIFKPTAAAIGAPIYAIFEGMFLGGISVLFDMWYPGIAMQAISLTIGTMFVMLFMYRSGMIKVTEKLRSGIMAATGAIFFVYLISFVMSFFGTTIPMIHEGGMMGIGFSILVIGVAAFNLLLDFDFIEKSSLHGSPKYMEWYGAFGLMVTLVWLYMEFLRLLSKLRD